MQFSQILWQPVVIVVLLMGSSLLIWLAGEKRQQFAAVWTVAALSAALAIAASMSDWVLTGHVRVVTYSVLPPLGLSFRIDMLSIALLVLFLGLGILLALYVVAFPLGENARSFRAVFLFVLASAVGVVMAGDLLSFFLFFEAMSLSFFILVIHNRSREAAAATFKYLYMAIGGSVLYFIALASVYFQSGSFAWRDGGFMQAGPYSALAFVGFMVAFGIKSGLFPLHLWMADAYGQAPAPAVALSSMIMLKTGAYGMIRIFHHVFGAELIRQAQWDQVVIALSLITILYGSFCAFSENDLMRRLAYSGMAQLGYIILGISLLTADAFTGGVYHVLAHAAMKGTLLLCAGIIIMKTGKRKISELKGIGWQIPVTMSCFAIASLTAVGLPPMNIFISKWYLSLGALALDRPVLILVLLASSVLNAAYYLPIVISAFFGESNRDMHAALSWDRVPLAMSIPTVLLAIGCFVFNAASVNPALKWVQNITAVFFQ
ncbi:MAG: proton-conducting transporter membrane subunit [Bacillota bacterium]|nr:proton-conducting transporter membrane subunit [Bacillota bacterium]MDW7683108.1 proton-conducting transporter membrane subunit [Bacillota bacterium]